MGFKIKLVAFLVGLIFLVIILYSIRRNNLKPGYTILWLAMSFFLLSIPILEPFYQWISYSVLGLIDARHIIYIFLIGFLLVYVFYLTNRISNMNDQIKSLITQVAILESRS